MRPTHDDLHRFFIRQGAAMSVSHPRRRPFLVLLRPLVKRLGGWFGLLVRAATLGVRGVVIDEAGRVLLVRHTYLPGWYLPGGGVDPGETAAAAVVREIAEETAVAVVGPPRLVGLYLNRRTSRRDHVALWVFDAPVSGAVPRPRRFEIAEVGFFARDALPEETTAATRRRLAEVFDAAAPTAEW